MFGSPEHLAALLNIHREKYTPQQQEIIRSRIRQAWTDGILNLANDDQATDFGNNKTGAGQTTKKSQSGKTRTQPRQYGGKFGKKGASNGEQAMEPQIDPEQIIGTINNLQVGQSVSLLGNNAKVKRLGSGYQLYKPDGSENRVVKDLTEATKWARGQMKGAK